MKSIIPNSLTAANLACGCIASLAFLNEFNKLGILLVLIGTLADFLDGFVARLLKVPSELGKQLDSLADMVSFGFVPGIIIYKALLNSQGIPSFIELLDKGNYIPLLGFLVTIFSAVRLAKFNIDTRQTDKFIGLPTPANTLFFITIPLVSIFPTNEWIKDILTDTSVLIGLTITFSFLLVAEIPLIALKFKNISIKSNLFRYSLVVLAITSIITLQHTSIPVIIIGYIVLSLIENILYRKR